MSAGRAIELYYEFAALRGDKTDVDDKKTAGNLGVNSGCIGA